MFVLKQVLLLLIKKIKTKIIVKPDRAIEIFIFVLRPIVSYDLGYRSFRFGSLMTMTEK